MRTITVESIVRFWQDGELVELAGEPKPLPVDKWPEVIRRLDVLEARRERERNQEHPEPTFTDLGLIPSLWEGPHVAFQRLIGEGAIWSGPRSLTLPDGSCAFCGWMPRLPGNAVCISPACLRMGWEIERTLGRVLDRPMVEDTPALRQITPARVKAAPIARVAKRLRGGRG